MCLFALLGGFVTSGVPRRYLKRYWVSLLPPCGFVTPLGSLTF